MFSHETHEMLFSILEVLAYTFVFVIGLGVLAVNFHFRCLAKNSRHQAKFSGYWSFSIFI